MGEVFRGVRVNSIVTLSQQQSKTNTISIVVDKGNKPNEETLRHALTEEIAIEKKNFLESQNQNIDIEFKDESSSIIVLCSERFTASMLPRFITE